MECVIGESHIDHRRIVESLSLERVVSKKTEMLETVGGNMVERENSHRLSKENTSFPSENKRSAETAKATRVYAQSGKLNSSDYKDCFYSDLLVTDTGLAEMWMELRV